MTDVTAEVAVTGVPVTEVNGRYVVPRLEARRTSVLGAVIAAVRDGRRVVSLDRAGDLNDWLDDGPDDWVNADRHPGLSRETRILAAAAAARSQGLPVKVTGTGAQVVAVRPGSPADGVLRPGDVVVAIDGDLVTQARPLAELLRQRAPGGSVRLSLDRAGRVEEATVVRSRESEGGIGIALETRDLAVELPFEVRFSDGGAGGRPESGLAYALAIADMISSSDLAGGRTIAAAGLLDDDGHVGPARETAAQAESAARARAALFVVAQDDAAAAPRDGLQVTGVDTLARALEALSTTV